MRILIRNTRNTDISQPVVFLNSNDLYNTIPDKNNDIFISYLNICLVIDSTKGNYYSSFYLVTRL